MYQPLRASRSTMARVRTLHYHLRHWGAGAERGGAAPLVLLHGWMDVGASWQFVVDAFGDDFAGRRRIVAPDWRGFGRSMPPWPCDGYHFVDYLADLDQLLEQIAPGMPVDLVGHSMGGNVAMLYAGARPRRVRRLVNLEGFGLPASQPEQAPGRLARWMDELGQCARGATALRDYASAEEVAARLARTNPRLSADKAAWLARQWASEGEDGRWRILGDAAHKVVSAQLYRVDEALALWAAIDAPVLSVQADEDSLARWAAGQYSLQEYHQRLARVRHCQNAVVQGAGHMLHHDQPQQVARLIEDFLQDKSSSNA